MRHADCGETSRLSAPIWFRSVSARSDESSFAWSVEIDVPQVEGSLRAKMTYNDKFCQMPNEPATGRCDGTTLPGHDAGGRATPSVYLNPH